MSGVKKQEERDKDARGVGWGRERCDEEASGIG